MARFVLSEEKAQWYERGEFLGEGGFASVYQVRERRSNTVYALKVVQLSGNTNVARTGPGGNVAQDDVEIELINCLQKTCKARTGFAHPNIIELREHWKQDGDTVLCMVMEYCATGSLRDGIEKGRYLPDINRLIEHIVGALHFCEIHNVLHLDIKPDNVLVRDFPDGNVYKLADFGLAHYRNTLASSILSAVGGTDQFKAPETVGRRKRITAKADVWATGLTLHWVVYKRFAFMNGPCFMNLADIIEELREEPDILTVPADVDIPAEARAAINRMVVVDMDRRASPSELASLFPSTSTVRAAIWRDFSPSR